MKRTLQCLVVAASLAAAATAHAVPSLQLYIDGSTYDAATETWTISSNSFDLWVLGDTDQGIFPDVSLAASFYGTGTLAITPTTTSTVADPSLSATPINLGSDATQFSGNQAFTAVASHAEYADAGAHQFWDLGGMSLHDSPIYDYTSDPPGGPDTGQINVYHIDITGYDMVHFDAFGSQIGSNGKVQFVKAPFSHDATSGGTNPVPEPGTLALMGSGLVGLAAARIRRRK